MAKKGISLGLTVTEREGKLFVRNKHNAGNSHNQERAECMKRQLSGKKHGSQAAQRAAFRAAAAACR